MWVVFKPVGEMGILDDAIREHLDLKRLHGAEDDEVKRLEDEAFGPPARPGEPDFPESQEQPAVEAGVATATETAQPEDSAPAMPEIETPPPAPEEPVSEGRPVAAPEAPPADPEAAEPESEAAFFDQELETELNLDDLDLEEGEGPDDAEQASDEHPVEPPSEEHPAEPASEEEHPVAGLETVEHPMEELIGDDPEAPATGEEELLEAPEEGAEEGEEDVLEETPEFLRDQPEDEELWFEQGEPKDFDF